MNIEQILVRIPNITVLTDFNTEFATPVPFSLGKLFFFFFFFFFFDHGISESGKQPNNDFLLLYRNQSINLRFRSTNFRIKN